MLIFNFIGLGITGVGVLLMVGIIAIEKSQTMAAVAFVVWGLWMIGMDLLYRKRIQKGFQNKVLFHPKAGGHLFFIPLWILGFAPIALAVVKTIQR
jgi:hypothetical protein